MITFIFADGTASSQEPDEYVAIKNTSAAAISLAGWRLTDMSDNTRSFTFQGGLVQPGQEVRVYTNEVHPEWGGYSFSRGTAIWNNCRPDIAGLFNPGGTLVSQATYAKSTAGC